MSTKEEVQSASGGAVLVDSSADDGVTTGGPSPEEMMEKIEPELTASDEKVIPKIQSAKDATILIIEDDKFLRDLTAHKLEKEGYAVIIAPDGEEAIKIMETTIPQLILLDIVLPGIDGFEVLRQIKVVNSLKNVPVILLTNLGQQEDVERGKSLGAKDFLIKAHVTLDEIVDKIKEIL